MSRWLDNIQLIGGWLTPCVEALALVAILVVVVRRSSLRWWVVFVGAAGVGAVLGLASCWYFGDRLDLFGVALDTVTRIWVAVALGAAGVLIAGIVRGRAFRRVVASVGLVFPLLAGALGVNADFGQYTTVGSLSGAAVAGRLPVIVAKRQKQDAPGVGQPEAGAATALWRNWKQGDAPNHGTISEIRIPGTVSHFAARDGYVYLPPAALTVHPVPLPVLIFLSGQPGGPNVVISAGRIREIFDRYAEAHNGLAPIVVVPDQLGAPQNNPMCVNSKLGNVGTYVTVDVVNWIRTHLAVQTRSGAWAIGGFSEGGTCSIQFGAGHPALFRSILDISGQVVPSSGSLAQTISRGFAGSRAAYEAALPLNLLRHNAPFSHTVAVFGAGALDAKYTSNSEIMEGAARTAGMTVTRLSSPGTAHDWATVRWVLSASLPTLLSHLGLEKEPNIGKRQHR